MHKLIIIMVVFILPVCSSIPINDLRKNSDSTGTQVKKEDDYVLKEEKRCKNVIRNLLHWYESFLLSDTTHDLVKIVVHNGNRSYRIDSLACHDYLGQFQKTGFFSIGYIKREWNKYLAADEELANMKPIEPPFGIYVLDADPLLGRQDAIEYLRNLDSMKFTNFQRIGESKFKIDIIIEDIQLRYILEEKREQMLVDKIEPLLRE